MNEKVNIPMTTMDQALEDLKAEIISSYEGWQKTPRTEIQCRMLEEFILGLRVETGRKYLKVISGSSVWGFVVNTDNDKKFRKGDILLAASWAAPARNKARGNVLDGDFSSVRWTSPKYL
jgi:hypothetical protein